MSDHNEHNEQEVYAILVEINQEPTELYKILKFENIVSGGGQAKQVISEGYVYLNGEVETRKRKKVYAGDLLYFNEQYFQIVRKGTAVEYEEKEPQSERTQPQAKKSRKPICF